MTLNSLSASEKIEALESVKSDLKFGFVDCMCRGIARWLSRKKGCYVLATSAAEYIPEIFYQKPISKRDGQFWWPLNEHGNKRRLTAINKTIKLIQTDL